MPERKTKNKRKHENVYKKELKFFVKKRIHVFIYVYIPIIITLLHYFKGFHIDITIMNSTYNIYNVFLFFYFLPLMLLLSWNVTDEICKNPWAFVAINFFFLSFSHNIFLDDNYSVINIHFTVHLWNKIYWE